MCFKFSIKFTLHQMYISNLRSRLSEICTVNKIYKTKFTLQKFTNRAFKLKKCSCNVMRKNVFALSICAFKFTVSENENVYAQISCGFINAVSLLYEAISTKAHHSSLISHFRFKIRALGDREI